MQVLLARGYTYHRARRCSRPQAAWYGLIDEAESAWITARSWLDEAVPVPDRVDLAISRWTLRRRMRRWPMAFGVQGPKLDCCLVCDTRWRAGRAIRDASCAALIERTVDELVRSLDRKLMHPIEPPRSSW